MKKETLNAIVMGWFGGTSLYYCLTGQPEMNLLNAVIFLVGYSLANLLLWFPDLIAKLNRE